MKWKINMFQTTNQMGKAPDNDRTKKSGIATSFCMVTGWKEGGFFHWYNHRKKIPVNVEFKTSTIFAIDSIDSFCKESWLLQNDSPAKNTLLQNGMVDQKNVLTKCIPLLGKCPWNGTWVKPFHSGNVHRDIYIYIYTINHSSWSYIYRTHQLSSRFGIHFWIS